MSTLGRRTAVPRAPTLAVREKASWLALRERRHNQGLDLSSGSGVKIGVGCSDGRDTIEATQSAYNQLCSKLSNRAPHMVIVNVSSNHDQEQCSAMLQELLPLTSCFLG
eukprot:3929496-Prymnesium_polylepis.2